MNTARQRGLLALVLQVICLNGAPGAQYSLRTVVTFNGANGSGPSVSLIDGNGNLFGTTGGGGANDGGTVFELQAGAQTVTTLATFSSATGNFPNPDLIADSDGNLFGTTSNAGPGSGGTLFEVAAGTHNFTNLATFNFFGSTTIGFGPRAGVIVDKSGNFYGTTESGGPGSQGTVFQVAAGTHAVSTLVAFSGFANGADPDAHLIADSSGNLYGTTTGGGANLDGTVFEIAHDTHAFTTLSTFNRTNGYEPNASLVLDSKGNLYGMTYYGGTNDNGTVFEIAAGRHELSDIVLFNGANGINPSPNLIIDASGNLFGTTAAGGAGTNGTVFEVAAGTHTLTTLATFSGPNGATPSHLVADANGNFFGGASGGSTTGGLIFELSPVPTLATWIGGSSSSWADGANWSTAAPGGNNVTTNKDTAVFCQASPNSPLVIDVGRNVQNITFDTAGVNSLTVGATNGPALLLTGGGTIQTTSTVVNPQTVNAPLVLEGDYTFGSGGSSSSATLSFSGGITPAATDGVTTLTLDGTNTGADTISGVLADNGAGRLAVTKSGSGVWTLSGANTYSGGTIVLGGTLRFNITSGSPTITAGATATVASGATLELAGSVSALGTAGGNRVHLTNNSIAPGVVVSGTNQVVRAIDGSGNVQVTAGSDLTADHIIQNALIIGGTLGSPGLVMIDASDASGNPLASLAVPLASASIMPLGAGGNLAYPIGYATNSDPLADWPPLIVSVAAAPAAVPEPSSLFMLAIGGLMVAHAALRRSRTLNWKNRSLPATIHQG